MGVNKRVFASLSEQANFYKLKENWEGQKEYRIYHNLPFLIIFNIDEITDISDIEKSRLKKTSIDFTICNKIDEPLICIDFDGLGQGVNLGSQYYSNRKVGFWRKEITELKLRIAHTFLFPYFVVGSRHFNDLGEKIKLTIVDGIIGAILSRRDFDRRFHEDLFPEGAGWSQEEYEILSAKEQYKIFKQWAIGIEVETELDNNPIAREISRLSHKLNAWSHSLKTMSLPSSGTEEKVLRGSKVIIHSQSFGDIEEQVYLPNFKVSGFSASYLAEQIARLLALEKLRVLTENGGKKVSQNDQ